LEVEGPKTSKEENGDTEKKKKVERRKIM